MGWFTRRSLLEEDVKKVNLEELSSLQIALIVKLESVNAEIGDRCRDIAELMKDNPKSAENNDILFRSADDCIVLNEHLRSYRERTYSA